MADNSDSVDCVQCSPVSSLSINIKTSAQKVLQNNSVINISGESLDISCVHSSSSSDSSIVIVDDSFRSHISATDSDADSLIVSDSSVSNCGTPVAGVKSPHYFVAKRISQKNSLTHTSPDSGMVQLEKDENTAVSQPYQLYHSEKSPKNQNINPAGDHKRTENIMGTKLSSALKEKDKSDVCIDEKSIDSLPSLDTERENSPVKSKYNESSTDNISDLVESRLCEKKLQSRTSSVLEESLISNISCNSDLQTQKFMNDSDNSFCSGGNVENYEGSLFIPNTKMTKPAVCSSSPYLAEKSLNDYPKSAWLTNKNDYRVQQRKSDSYESVKSVTSDKNASETNLSSSSTNSLSEEEIKNRIKKNKLILKTANVNALPDKGAKLKQKIVELEETLATLNLNGMPNNTSSSSESLQPNKKSETVIKPYLFKNSNSLVKLCEDNDKMNSKERVMVRVTSDAVEQLHKSLETMPNIRATEEEQPKGLKINLMPHQKRALAWMLWRETQTVAGGILADDMGLGKTLTVLSLIMRHREIDENSENEEFPLQKTIENLHFSGSKKSTENLTSIIPSVGTLVVCPASLMGQWEGEAKRRFHSKALKIFIYHGNSRNINVTRLASYDIVITTFQLVMKEAFSSSKANKEKGGCGLLFQISWTRVVLDEAHQIRNYKTKTSQAACLLNAKKRWAVTGTPVQNNEMDLYSLIRFLRVSPFNDLLCWKQLKVNSAHGVKKLNVLVQALLLRRTKDQVDEKTGHALVELPPKESFLHNIILNEKEREIYDTIFTFSRLSLMTIMNSQEQDKAFFNNNENCSSSLFPQLMNKKYAEKDNAANKLGGIKIHHMLVLLLRLRQVCCHPALIQSILDKESKEVDELPEESCGVEDITQCIEQLNLDDKGLKTKIKENILNWDNPVFKEQNPSSKIVKLIEELQKLCETTNEKVVIVSQWTSMLNLIHRHLKRNRLEATSITGQVSIAERTAIVDQFNSNQKNPRIMLLSLSAGGVGLNLIGANHLFLLDMHWNPQLEAQACDRIYRVGQTRSVHIHKFVTMNTVEEKILELQQKKIDLAHSVLTTAKTISSSKLTLHDLKSLFNV